MVCLSKDKAIEFCKEIEVCVQEQCWFCIL